MPCQEPARRAHPGGAELLDPQAWPGAPSGAPWSQACPQPLDTALGCESPALMLQPAPFLSPIHLAELSHT